MKRLLYGVLAVLMLSTVVLLPACTDPPPDGESGASGASSVASAPASVSYPPSQATMEQIGRVSIMPRNDQFDYIMANLDQWAQVRAFSDVYGNADHQLNRHSPDDEVLSAGFAKLKEWGMKLELEVGAVKEWAVTGNKTFTTQKPMWDRFIRCGMEINALSFDEPLINVLHNEAYSFLENREARFQYAVKETADFIEQVRKHYPNTLVGDIEVYDSLTAEENIRWIDALQSELASRGVRGMDYYRMDVNWAAFKKRKDLREKHWKEVVAVQEHCKSVGLPFSMIYWSSNVSDYYEEGQKIVDNPDKVWYDAIMKQGEEFKAVGGNPDQFCFETWINIENEHGERLQMPPTTLPETLQYSWMNSVLDFYEKYMK